MKLWLFLMKLGRMSGCHQKPERSFFIRGYQFPVCVRCTGICIGCLMAFILCSWIGKMIALNLFLCVPLVIDGGGQLLKWWSSNTISRMTTGILAGIGSMELEIMLIKKIIESVGNYI